MHKLLVAVAAAAAMNFVAAAQTTAPVRQPKAAPKLVASHPATAAKPAGLPVEDQNKLVAQYCVGCHSERGKAGGLSLAGFDAAQITKHPETAEKMIRKLRAGMMPPPQA